MFLELPSVSPAASDVVSLAPEGKNLKEVVSGSEVVNMPENYSLSFLCERLSGRSSDSRRTVNKSGNLVHSAIP